MQYKCIYCLLDWRKNIHIVTNIQQHDWLSTTWQQFMRGPDGHRTDMRTTSGCSPVPSESRTSWGRGSSQAARSQTAGPATACEECCASWRLSGSGWGPWCSWGPFAGFHTWTVFCPGPTGGPLYVSDQRLCSNPASSSSLWRLQPSVASWLSHISLGSWSLVLRTLIQSLCSWLGETSWFSGWRIKPVYVLRSERLSYKSTDLSEKFSSFSFRVPQKSPQCYSLADVQAVCPLCWNICNSR